MTELFPGNNQPQPGATDKRQQHHQTSALQANPEAIIHGGGNIAQGYTLTQKRVHHCYKTYPEQAKYAQYKYKQLKILLQFGAEIFPTN
jgi:hypothetical protein